MIFFSLREQRIFCYTPKKMLNSIDFYSKTFTRTFWIHCISALKRVKFMWFDLDIISFLWIELFIESDFVTLPISWRFSCLLPLHLSAWNKYFDKNIGFNDLVGFLELLKLTCIANFTGMCDKKHAMNWQKHKTAESDISLESGMMVSAKHVTRSPISIGNHAEQDQCHLNAWQKLSLTVCHRMLQ